VSVRVEPRKSSESIESRADTLSAVLMTLVKTYLVGSSPSSLVSQESVEDSSGNTDIGRGGT
jgi:hypothetical protein